MAITSTRIVELLYYRRLEAEWLAAVLGIEPRSPGGGIGAKIFAGDIAQSLPDPLFALGVEGGIAEKIQQRRHGEHALLLLQHAGLRYVASRPLADYGRRIVLEDGEQRRDGLVGAQQANGFNCPAADAHIVVSRVFEQNRQNAVRLDAAAA